MDIGCRGINSAICAIIDQIHAGKCDSLRKEIPCASSVSPVLESVAKCLGFSYVQYTRRVILPSSVAPQDSYSAIYGNYPVEWTNYYTSNRFYETDPVTIALNRPFRGESFRFGTCKDAIAAFRVEHADAQESQMLKKKSNHVIELAARFGLNAGVYGAIGDSDSQSYISFATPNSEEYVELLLSVTFWRAIKAILLILEDIVGALQRCSLCAQGVQNNSPRITRLTQTQKVILRLFLANSDATIEAIAKLHNTSANNINYHLKKVRSNFGLRNVSGHSLAYYAKKHHLL